MKIYLDLGEGKKLIKDIAAIYNIRIIETKGQKKPVLAWTIDLKNG